MADKLALISPWPNDATLELRRFNPAYCPLLTGLLEELLPLSTWYTSDPALADEMNNKIEELIRAINTPYECATMPELKIIRIDHSSAWNVSGGASVANTWVKTALLEREIGQEYVSIVDGTIAIAAGKWHVSCWHKAYVQAAQSCTCRLVWDSASGENIGYWTGSNGGMPSHQHNAILRAETYFEPTILQRISLDIHSTQALADGLGRANANVNFGDCLHGSMLIMGYPD